MIRELSSDPARIELGTTEEIVYAFDFTDRILPTEALTAIVSLTFRHIESGEPFPLAVANPPTTSGNKIVQLVVGASLVAGRVDKPEYYSMVATAQIGARKEAMETIVAVYF